VSQAQISHSAVYNRGKRQERTLISTNIIKMAGRSPLHLVQLEDIHNGEGHKNSSLHTLWKYTIILDILVMREGGITAEGIEFLCGVGTTRKKMLGNIYLGLSHKMVVTNIIIHAVYQVT
jgi:hypothetical protein